MKIPELILAHIQVQNKKCEWIEMPKWGCFKDFIQLESIANDKYSWIKSFTRIFINPNHFFNKIYRRRFNGLVYGGFNDENDFFVLCAKWTYWTSIPIKVKSGDIFRAKNRRGDFDYNYEKYPSGYLREDKLIGNLLEAYAETGEVKNELSNKIFK